ncbi:Mss4-like protein [Xylariales sp. PMI_506]|nr:Mss4-like protein [Xylariales sp. PMI_506]
MPTGKCLCGSIEVEAEGGSSAKVACSCTSCQRCSASTFTVNLVYPKGGVEVTKGKEHLKLFKEIADSGREVHRYFCDTCGNAIFSQIQDGTIFLKAPVLEGALDGTPDLHIFTRNLPAWAEGVGAGDRRRD